MLWQTGKDEGGCYLTGGCRAAEYDFLKKLVNERKVRDRR